MSVSDRRPAPASTQRPAAPLAEGRWLWRRIYVFGVSFGLWVLLAAAVRSASPEGLVPLARGLMGLQALLLVLYLVAPTAQQLIELLANLRLRLGAGGRP